MLHANEPKKQVDVAILYLKFRFQNKINERGYGRKVYPPHRNNL